jgi:hypothetical protein
MITAQEYYAPQEPFSGTTVVEIAVPSGKLIASDDLRMGPLDIEPQQSINYGVGADAYSRLFAETRNVACGGKTVAEANAEFNSETFFLIDVTPGKYRWTVYSHSESFDSDVTDRVVFAKLELIEAFKTSSI